MFRGLILAVAAAIVVLVAVGLVGGQQSAEAQETASATRSFSPSEVEPGGTLTVTITVAGYGAFGQLREAFPADFTFVSSSPEATRSGQTLTFNLLAGEDSSVSYTLTAPTTSGEKSGFSGTLEPTQGDGVTVSGPSAVTVSPPSAQETASATRSFSPSEVEPGGTLTVTITVAGYGAFGQLREAFPADFTFVSSSPEATRSGQTLTFNLLAGEDSSVSYTLTAPTTSGEKSGFSGTLEPTQGDGVTVSGPSAVTVSPPSAQETASATRSFSPSEVEPGGTLTVTITVAGYGAFGQLREAFPADFTFVSSSPEATRSGQTLTFNLLAGEDSSVSYTLTAPTTSGEKSGFSGTLEPTQGDGVTVSGPSAVGVGSPPAPPQPPAPQPSNSPPRFSETAPTRSIAENSAAGTAVGAPVRATDPDGDSLTYTLGGSDAATFSIDGTSGQLMTFAALDYETKPSYSVEVTARDNRGGRVTVAVAVAVTNVDELGALSGSTTNVSVNEGDTDALGTYTLTAIEDGPAVTWSLDGADMSDFMLEGTGMSRMLKFKSAPDFEAPMGGADNNSNTYMVTVMAKAGGEMEMVAVTVMVDDVDELGALGGSDTASINEGATDLGTYTLTGGAMGATATWSVEGTDMSDFMLEGTGMSRMLKFKSAPDYESPMGGADDDSNTYMVTVMAKAGGEMAMVAVTVMVTNVEEQGTVTLNPDRPLVGTALTASLTDPDGGVTGETWRWSRSDAADGTFTGIGGATRASYTPVEADEGMYLKITVTYTDGHGPDKTATAGAMVSDPLIARYDANKDGTIEIRELFEAIDHYFDGTIELSELFKVIDYYFDG